LVQFTSFLIDVFVIAALWTLQPTPAPVFGEEDAQVSPDSAGGEAAAGQARRLIKSHPSEPITLAQMLGLKIPEGLLMDLAGSFGSGSIIYERSYFTLAATAMLISIIVGVVTGIFSAGYKTLSPRNRTIFLAFAPVSLHTLYMGYLHALALKTATKKAALIRARERHDCVVMMKMIQSAFQCIPLALITACTLEMTPYWHLFLAALTMGVISITYGFYGYTAQIFRSRLSGRPRARVQMFVCLCIHISWVTASLASFIAARRLGHWRWSCLVIMLFIGFQQLVPSLRGGSSSTGWATNALALIVMTPLACLAVMIDGPLLGFTTMRTPEAGLHVGESDRQVAGRRRVFLFLFAAVASIVDYIHLPAGLPQHPHVEFQGYDVDLTEVEYLLEIPEMSIRLTHVHVFLIRVSLLFTLFFLDLFASPRAWMLAGLSTSADPVAKLISCWSTACGFWRPTVYAEIGPEFEAAALTPKATTSEFVQGSHQNRLTEDQQRLHDALEALYWHMTDIDARLVAAGAKRSAMVADRVAYTGANELGTAFANFFSQRVERTAAAEHQGSISQRLDDSDVPERVATESLMMLKRLLLMSQIECMTAESIISRFVPASARDGYQANARGARMLLGQLQQINVPALQRRAQQEALALRVAANGGLGHHPFRSLPVSVALSSPALWRGERLYELSRASARAKYFISHHRGDPGGFKGSMLRDFIFVQPLVTRMLLCLPMLSLILLPLGVAYCSIIDGPPMIYFAIVPLPRVVLPSTVPLIALVLLLVWIAFSSLGCLPIRYTPWNSADEALWMENACADESRVAAMLKEGFDTYLSSCDKMIAFVSPEYFSRLWCVYELASFCRRYDGALHKYLEQDLVLLSKQWVSTLNPCKVADLTDEELEPILSFRCRDAETFKPCDRAVLLSYIRRDWGSEEAFDEFVRTELPTVLAGNKRRYTLRIGKLAEEHIDLAFGG
jgi:hypothetical protein